MPSNNNNGGGIIGRRKARNDLLLDDEGDNQSLIADTPTTQESLHMTRPTDEELVKIEEKKRREMQQLEEEEENAANQQHDQQQQVLREKSFQQQEKTIDNRKKEEHQEGKKNDKKPEQDEEVGTKKTTKSDLQSSMTESINLMKERKKEQQQQRQFEDECNLKSEKGCIRQPEREITSCFQPSPRILHNDEENTQQQQEGGGTTSTESLLSSPTALHVTPGTVHVDRNDHSMVTHLFYSVANAKLAGGGGGGDQQPTTTTDEKANYRTTTTTAADNNPFTNNMMTDLEDLAGGLMPMPMPTTTTTTTTTTADGRTTTNTRVRVTSVPGAHRGTGMGSAGPLEHVQPLYKGGMHVLGRVGSVTNEEEEDGDDDGEEGRLTNNNHTTTDGTERLVEPDPEQSPLGAVMNAQVEAAAAAPSKEEKGQFPWHYKLAAAGGGVFVVIVVAIVVALVVVSSGGGSTDDEEEFIDNNNNPGTLSAVLNLPPLDTVFPNPEELELIPFSTREAIETNNIDLPQVQAYQWLVQDEKMIQYGSPSQLRQRLALATFFYSTNGQNWLQKHGGDEDGVAYLNNNNNNNNTWLDYDTHECSWFSSLPSRSSYALGACGDDYVPTENPWDEHVDYKVLALPGVGPLSPTAIGGGDEVMIPELRGSLVPELVMLTSLEGLDVSYQKVKGTIPADLTQLSSTLQYVRLNDCHFTGVIPDGIYEFPKQLRLGNNSKLEVGTIPTTIGLNTHLTQLTLEDTNRHGTIPTQIGLLSASAVLVDLNYNSLKGQVPTELGQLTKLQQLLLAENTLIGSLPTSLSSLSNLRVLRATKNPYLNWQLTPELFITPAGTASWPHLTDLKLGQTGLAGSVVSEIGLLRSLQVLDLQNNKLDGQLPSELGLLPALRVVNVINNEPGIIVPQELCGLLWKATPEC